ncbi:MAG: ADP-ribosylglycohydrolase family protein [Ilumatobacteraceae bacterium]
MSESTSTSPVSKPSVLHPVWPADDLDYRSAERVLGVITGAAVGDALGAPFEFGPAGAYSARFPQPEWGGTGEMTGGGGFGWAPGEFTDDSQMAMCLAESIIACGGIDPDDLWRRWQHWSRSAADVGIITSATLHHDERVGAAESAHHDVGRSASNGALMRVYPLALAYLGAPDNEATDIVMAAAVEQAAITHYDPAAGWGAAIAAELIRRAVLRRDPIAEIDDVLGHVPAEHRARFTVMLAPDWVPNQPGDPSNGSVWGCLAQAVWALRHHGTFHDAITAAIDLGGDTDTVACVAGALAGARFGIQGIPSRWLTYVHGTVDSPDGHQRYDLIGLQNIARRLRGKGPISYHKPENPAGPFNLRHDGIELDVHAADLQGTIDAATADPGFAVYSLCAVGDSLAGVPVRRAHYVIDEPTDVNDDLFAVVHDAVETVEAWRRQGHRVIVHCHGGRSRTTLVLRAWAMKYLGYDADSAYDWICQWHRFSDHNYEFTRFLRDEWTDHCDGLDIDR